MLAGSLDGVKRQVGEGGREGERGADCGRRYEGETDGKTLTLSAVLILAVIFHLHSAPTSHIQRQ